MFVVVVRDVWYDRIVGLFHTQSEAIAYAVNNYGWAYSSHRWEWKVRPLEEA